MRKKLYFVYILASRPFGPIYIGMTNDPRARIVEHRQGSGSKHVAKYRIYRLVYLEEYENVDDAIAREKQLKRWRRAWKDALIEENNPGWHDLFDRLEPF